MKWIILVTMNLLISISFGSAKKSDIEEVKYRRLQATPEKYFEKSVIVNCDIRKYVPERSVLDADCDKEQTGGPCIYKNNSWICLMVPKTNQAMIDYLIDELVPGSSHKVKIVGRMDTNKKFFNIEEIRFCNSTTIECEPYAKVLK